MRLSDLAIRVSGESRPIAYTNKEAGVFYTELNVPNTDPWQGWRVMSAEILEDYRIQIDGALLARSGISFTEAFPHQFVRYYQNGVVETVTMLDSIDAIVVALSHVGGSTVTFAPLFQNARAVTEFTFAHSTGVASVARVRHQLRTAAEDYPPWIAVCADDPDALAQNEPYAEGTSFSPVALHAKQRDGNVVFILVAGNTAIESRQIGTDLRETYPARIGGRTARMEQLLARAHFRSNLPAFDTSVSWAILSMDALVMNQIKKGIFAGLPWFDNYWGRDSFISLPGATIVSGRLSDTRRILESFAEWQDTVASHPTYGRVPNLVTVHSLSYNTADGTPWFVVGLDEYFSASGDSDFVRRLYPVVRRAVEGTLLHHVDSLGFLTHADAESWMDAVGPDGAWSPRGNRACDIQALWYRQLRSASRMAECSGDDESAVKWRRFAAVVRDSFNRFFVDVSAGRIFDHLNSDGTADTMFRPNQLFAMDLLEDPMLRTRLLSSVTSRLVYKHGVASLSQDDPMFHPYHHYAPYYVQDAAYHQGIVWTWLAGAWIEEMNAAGGSELAWDVTSNMSHQILHRGAVGTLSELLDAVPRDGESEPRLSGTYSQAWSLAEFLRVLFRSYAGVTVDHPSARIRIAPRLPEALSYVESVAPYGDQMLGFVIRKNESALHLTIAPFSLAESLTISLDGPPAWNPRQAVEVRYLASHGLDVRMSDQSVTIESAGRTLQPLSITGRVSEPAVLRPLPSLQVPAIRPGLAALKGPEHRVLRNEEIKRIPESPVSILDKEDPAGDDTGPGSYVYPTTPYLLPGSLDLLHARVLTDSVTAMIELRFRSLSNPGWHPEYGFQLTYAAILIDRDGTAGVGATNAGMNSDYTLPEGAGFEYAVYVGGGVRVTDAQGKILAEYLPHPDDISNALGDVASGTVRFSLPSGILGYPDSTSRFYVLVGCQDDHGGAGVGEFRAVGSTAAEWVGGGRTSSTGSNVYDLLLPERR